MTAHFASTILATLSRLPCRSTAGTLTQLSQLSPMHRSGRHRASLAPSHN